MGERLGILANEILGGLKFSSRSCNILPEIFGYPDKSILYIITASSSIFEMLLPFAKLLK